MRLWDWIWEQEFPFAGKKDGYDFEGIFVDPDCIIMQYIGMQDENKKEFYEGDIFIGKDADGKKSQWEIKWIAGGFQADRGESDYTLEMTHWAGFELEIIGNVYENPELLEKKE